MAGVTAPLLILIALKIHGNQIRLSCTKLVLKVHRRLLEGVSFHALTCLDLI
jgi:hypothetical protein